MQLRTAVARLERTTPERAGHGPVLRFGLGAIDRHLPAGGLGPGLHEFAAPGPGAGFAAAPTLLAAFLLGTGTRGAGGNAPVLWVTERSDLHPPGLAAVGLAPHRLVVVEAGRDVLAAMEDGARASVLAGVVGEWGGPLGLTASRRLLLAAERSGVPVLLIRRPWRQAAPGASSPVDAPNAALTRWRVGALPSCPPDPIEAGPFTLTVAARRWRLDLVRARGAAPHSWIVEAFDASGRLAHPAPSRDRPAAPVGAVAAAGDRAA